MAPQPLARVIGRVISLLRWLHRGYEDILSRIAPAPKTPWEIRLDYLNRFTPKDKDKTKPTRP